MPTKPSFELRLRVLNAVNDAPGNTMRQRIKFVADKRFSDVASGTQHQFTWRTISTWLYRHKVHGIEHHLGVIGFTTGSSKKGPVVVGSNRLGYLAAHGSDVACHERRAGRHKRPTHHGLVAHTHGSNDGRVRPC